MKKNLTIPLFSWDKGKRKMFFMRLGLLKLMLIFGIMGTYANVNSQTIIPKLKLHEVELSETLERIEELSSYDFVFNYNDLKGYKVSVDLEEISLENCLNEVLKDVPFVYQTKGDVVVISYQEKPAPIQKEKKELKGTITDKDGNTLPGVSVVVKGTTVGVATDMDGNYSIKFEGDKVVLLFSFVGMLAQEITYTGQSVQNVTLAFDSEQMEEVIVTGYFTKNKNSFTGSVVSVNSEELTAVSNSNLLSTIQSFDPSFVVLDNNMMGSDPNSMPDITVRGGSSLPVDGATLRNNPNAPVYILDGFQVSAEKIFDLDMSRVKSFTILKDASATAIYGSRAANGVVVIESKKPKAGKLQVYYNYDLTVSVPDISDYNLLNAKEKLEYEKLAGIYTNDFINKQVYNIQVSRDDLYKERLIAANNGVNTHWLAKPLQVSYGHKHSLSLEGGDDAMRYVFNVQSNTSNGVMKKSGRKVYGADMKLLYRLNKINFQNILSVSDVKSTDSPFGSFSKYAQANPYFKYRDKDGNLTRYLGYSLKKVAGKSHFYNYAYDGIETNNLSEQKYTSVSDQFLVDYKIIEGLKLKASFNINKMTRENQKFVSPESVFNLGRIINAKEVGDDLPTVGSYKIFNSNSTGVEGRLSLSYQKIFGKNVIDAFVNYEVKETKYESHSVTAEGFTNDKMVNIGFASQYEKNGIPSSSKSTARQVGFLTNLSYTWDGKYLTDFSYRVDGSSAFGSNKHFAPFWSTGIAWNLHKENFLKNTIIDYLKIKANTGVNGSVQFEPFQGIRSYAFNSSQRYADNVGATLLGIGNPDLQWQKTTNKDLGIDLELLDHRFSLNATYYNKQTEGQITDVSCAPSIGFSSYVANIGTIENKGYELSTKFVFINNKKSDLYLSVWGRLAHNDNKIVKISESLKTQNENILLALESEKANSDVKRDTPDSKDQKSIRPIMQFEEGSSIYDIRAIQSLGIDPANGQEIFKGIDGQLTYDWNPRDQVVVGSTEADIQGNFGFDARYKRFSLNASFYYSYGAQIFNQTLLDRIENATPYYNVDKRVLTERWKKPGDISTFKSISDESLTRSSSRFVEDNNILSLQRLSVSYDFNKEMLAKLGLNTLKMAIYMNDVFKTTTVKMERGTSYPFARSVSFSLRCNF